MYHSSPISFTHFPAKRNLTFYGISTLSIEPNICKITIGINTESQNVTTAQRENASIHQQVVRAILDLGIPSANIQTVDYTIFPLYDYTENTQIFRGYKVTHLLSIIVETIKYAGTVIDTAVQNGANQVTTNQFDVRNRAKYYEKALQKAVKDTLSKAQAMAETLHITINPIPVRLVEIPSGSPLPLPLTKMSISDVGGISTNLEAGQLVIEARVEAKFSY